MKKAFFLVGHENFGKSKTFVELSGKTNSRYITIDNSRFVLRRKSNDDIGKELFDAIESFIVDAKYEHILIAFCPDFADKDKYSEKILKILKKNEFKLYFFVLMKKYNGEDIVNKKEIDKLKEYGIVYKYYENKAANIRSKELKEFIKKYK